MFIVCLIIIVIYFIYLALRSTLKPSRFPPGPKWYPIFGCNAAVKALTKSHGSLRSALSQLRKKYSTNVLGLKLGNEMVVVLYGLKNVRQMFLEREFEARPDNYFARLRCFGTRLGITFADGELWRKYRHFTVKQLKNVGFGKTAMEKEIQEVMKSIVQSINKGEDRTLDPKNLLATSVLNVLWKFTAGDAIDEEKLHNILDLFSKRSKVFEMAGGWLNIMPWSRFIFPELTGYSIIVKLNQQLSDIINEAIRKHKEFEIKEVDFMNSFLEEMKVNKEYTEELLKIICLDLLIAGSQTTSNTIMYALLIIIRNQHIQDKIYDEIHSVIGQNTPCWMDSQRLIYTSAFLLEVHRHFSMTPLVGPRRTLADIVIDGYIIPKGTTILSDIADIHFSAEIWENPNEFRPERFIGNNGELINPEHLYVFGLGRRKCPGNSLAKSFLFIAFVSLIQNFKIECSNGMLPSSELITGILSCPKPFRAKFVPRLIISD